MNSMMTSLMMKTKLLYKVGVMSSKIALLQANPVVGDIKGNSKIILEMAKLASENGASFAVTTELAISGYPP